MDANLNATIAIKRRTLLPWWIKIFSWLFLIFGAVVPIALILGLIGVSFEVSMYGLTTTNPVSLVGIAVLCCCFFC